MSKGFSCPKNLACMKVATSAKIRRNPRLIGAETMVGARTDRVVDHPAVSLGGRTQKRRRIPVIGRRCGSAEGVPWVPPSPRSSAEVGPRLELRVGRSNDPQSSVPLPQSESGCCTGTGIDWNGRE